MRIIKQGKIDSEPKTFKCHECGCVFEAESAEYSKWRSSMDVMYCVAICPCCGENVLEED